MLPLPMERTLQRIFADQLLLISSGIIDTRNAVHLRMVDERFKDQYHAALDSFDARSPRWEEECRRIGMPATAAGINRAREAFKVDGPLFVRTRLDELRMILGAEAAALEMLALPPQSRNVEEEAAFGVEVALRFPALTEDIADAAKCLAMGLGTATVFHLMRVMELAVQDLGRRLRIRIDVRGASWHTIAQHVERGIKTLPAQTAKQKERKESLALAVAHLNAVRIAWRNQVMHPKATYTVDEARAIFAHVSLFTGSLAKF